MELLAILGSLIIGLAFTIDRMNSGEGGCGIAFVIMFCFAMVAVIAFFGFLTSMM